MDIVVTEKPHMLLETVELLYACVNKVSPEFMTCPGTYCLPVEAIREMMDMAEQEFSLSNSTLRYYFGKRVFFEDPEQTTCIARNLLYKNSAVSFGSVSDDFRELRRLWRYQAERNWRLTAINKYHLSFGGSPDDQYAPLASDVAKLGVSTEYGQMLLEQLAGYEAAIARLEAVITPLAQRLEPLLRPWAEQAEPLAQAWRDYYARPDAGSKLYHRIQYTDEGRMRSVHVQLRYLRPKDGPGNTWSENDDHRIFLHTGVAIPVERSAQGGFEPRDFQALRLLGSESRMQMLRVMLDRPMSSRELAKTLNLHLGVVTRDVSSLHDVGLLTLEISSRHRRYRTNLQTLQALIRRLSDLEHYTFPQLDHL